MFEDCNCIVVKVTRDCNLRCKYCYVADKDKYRGEVMSFDVFKKLVDRICLDKNKSDDPKRRFSFVFHGGEPTIIGYDALNKFCHYAQTTFSNNNLNFELSMQTNSTLVDEKLMSLFYRYDINVGGSFDGGSGTSNKARTSKSTKSFEELFKFYKKSNVNFGLLSVVSPSNIEYSKQNISKLKKLGIFSGKWNYAEDVLHNGEYEVTADEFFEKSFIPLFKELKHKKKAYKESNVTSILEHFFRNLFSKNNEKELHNNYSGNCYIKFCGAGSRVLEVSPDGTINYCGRYAKDDDISKCNDLENTDFLAATTRKKYYEHILIKHNLLIKNGCDVCEASEFCDYGCMAFSYVKTGDFNINSEFVCKYFKRIKQYLVENVAEAFDLFFNFIQGNKNEKYFRLSVPVDDALCDFIKRKISGSKKYVYKISPDKNWNKGKGKSYQIKIERYNK